jgi:hypothetical protein
MSTLCKNLIFLTVIFLLILPNLGHAAISGFYGTYSLTYTEGSCAQQRDLTIGNDSGRAGEDGYLYTPSGVEYFVYKGVQNGDPFTNTIAVKGGEILVTRFIKQATDLSKGHTTVFKMKFSANYKNGTITGNSTDDNLSGCQGIIKGTSKRN